MKWFRRASGAALAFAILTGGAGAGFCKGQQTANPQAGVIEIRHSLVIGPIVRGGRSVLHQDPIEAELVTGTWAPPTAGAVVPTINPTSDDKKAWKAVEADKDGWLKDEALGGGYAYASVPSDGNRVLLLEAQGHNLVYVNGVPRTGDPYAYGYVRLPIALHSGNNDLLFLVGRGQLRARLTPPPAAVFLDGADSTLPDLTHGQRATAWGAVVLTNATQTTLRGLKVEAGGPGLKTSQTAIAPIPPLSTRKIPFWIQSMAPEKAGDRKVTLQLLGTAHPAPDLTVSLRVREPGQTVKRTFRSRIDDSVQYYALNPAYPAPRNKKAPALILTLHGASVEAIGQADAYAPKTWAELVAPTNRRPYGFDWEDWGRKDALEVLDIAKKTLHTDPHHTYLTGHSMGGHGTWQIGVTYPDHFAAIAPSAGWISFYSYAGGQKADKPDPIQSLLQRAAAQSDTLQMSQNYAEEAVYILHGGADDNVPVTEARFMNHYLAAYHKDFAYHEEPGAGHWWGSKCVDWPPIFDLFQHRVLHDNAEVPKVRFTTLNPRVSATSHWLTIAQQVHTLEPSNAEITADRTAHAFVGTTSNVALLALDPTPLHGGERLTITLDGQMLPNLSFPPQNNRIWLRRTGTVWELDGPPDSGEKTPERSGPFKEAFDHKMMFVYGTQGTGEENAWAYAKARYDAETFWYRGNGAVDVVADTDFHSDRQRDRSIVLYGNADTNRAWKDLLSDSPIQVKRNHVQIAKQPFTGGDFACLFLRPRPGSASACVAVVSGSGLRGMRLADRIPIFLSGAGLPDYLLLTPASLTQGEAGVRAAGFFGNDWRVESGDFVWGSAPGP